MTEFQELQTMLRIIFSLSKDRSMHKKICYLPNASGSIPQEIEPITPLPVLSTVSDLTQ